VKDFRRDVGGALVLAEQSSACHASLILSRNGILDVGGEHAPFETPLWLSSPARTRRHTLLAPEQPNCYRHDPNLNRCKRYGDGFSMAVFNQVAICRMSMSAGLLAWKAGS
jgi:hypothetical protein